MLEHLHGRFTIGGRRFVIRFVASLLVFEGGSALGLLVVIPIASEHFSRTQVSTIDI